MVKANQEWTSKASGASYHIVSVSKGQYPRNQKNSMGYTIDSWMEQGKIVKAYTFDWQLENVAANGRMDGKRCWWTSVPMVDFEQDFVAKH